MLERRKGQQRLVTGEVKVEKEVAIIQGCLEGSLQGLWLSSNAGCSRLSHVWVPKEAAHHAVNAVGGLWALQAACHGQGSAEGRLQTLLQSVAAECLSMATCSAGSNMAVPPLHNAWQQVSIPGFCIAQGHLQSMSCIRGWSMISDLVCQSNYLWSGGRNRRVPADALGCRAAGLQRRAHCSRRVGRGRGER